jgi:predicted MFS family arabinose efflux permease
MAGSYVAATSLGGLSGRMVVTPLAEHLGWRTSLAVLGAVVAILMSVLIFLLPAGETPSAPRPAGGTVLGHLRDPRMLALFGIGGSLVGGMIAVFNYLPFRLEAPPYSLTPTVVSLIFLAYLGGTIGSQTAERLAGRVGSSAVLALACFLLAAGAAVTLAGPLAVIVIGVVVLTTGLFIGHAVATHLVAARASNGRAQASALYTISYYAGSSVFGWIGGLAWIAAEWAGVVTVVVSLGIAAALMTARAAVSRSE